MENLSHIGTIKSLLQKYGFSFSKRLGQNFLINPSVCPRMAEASGANESTGILEIGAGIGVLTNELCKRAAKVVCVEIDERLFPLLSETLGEHRNLSLVQGDILQVDLPALLQEHFSGLSVAVCANLPYYITSPVLMRLLESGLPFTSITVMVQKEAAARICAKEGSREIGAISLAIRYYSEPRILFPVSRGSFLPAPDVDSCVIQLIRHAQPPVEVCSKKALFQVIHAAFSQRRKTLKNTLQILSIEKNVTEDVLTSLSLPSTTRPEELSLQQFADLTNALYERGAFKEDNEWKK